MAGSNRYLVGIFGGVGAGKKLLSETLTRHLRDPRIEIFHTFHKTPPPAHLDYRIYIDRPFDKLLEKYVLNLPVKSLIDKKVLEENLKEFRRFHMENVVLQKVLADFWFTGEAEDDKIHQLAMEIMRKRRNFDEEENVRIYLEANHGNGGKNHPDKLKARNSIIF
ncbi:hypothetical protein GCK72_021586 [Caenorhabditis remanei]|uniref:Uncharacterized protein n=1 Tax=Caenorhabditis remanei TaxID=31234 RepID=A0A6A5GL62_CAERE|nr:hypothetical protein GCK72_021586 [Caenorhabditis remanei]KAF1755019.1 hypothetical protein GCK72_021586 [Caenorhabditis remanei]